MTRRRIRSVSRVALAALLTAAAAGLTACAAPNPPAGGAASPSATPALALPADVHAYFIGDSWSSGFDADPQRAIPQVTAKALGWTFQVDAVPGTGYVHIDDAGTHTFAARAAAIPAGTQADVAVVIGSVNDARSPLSRLPSAVAAAITALHTRLPDAEVVLVGPAPNRLPVSSALLQIDAILRTESRKHDALYISPITEQWLDSDNLSAVVDPATAHPSVAGDAYLGDRLAQDIRALETSAEK